MVLVDPDDGNDRVGGDNEEEGDEGKGVVAGVGIDRP